MVKEIKNNKRRVYQCEECGFVYAAQELAKKCEAWCKAHKSCNLSITKFAVADK